MPAFSFAQPDHPIIASGLWTPTVDGAGDIDNAPTIRYGRAYQVDGLGAPLVTNQVGTLRNGDLVYFSYVDGVAVAKASAFEVEGFQAADVPYFEQFQDDMDASSTTTVSAINTVYQVEPPITLAPASGTNLWEQAADGVMRYVGEEPYKIACFPMLSGRMSGSAIASPTYILRNGLALDTTRRRHFANGQYDTTPPSAVLVQQYDELAVGIANRTNTGNYICEAFSHIGLFAGFAAISMSAEKFENPDIVNTDGFSAVQNCTIAASGGELTATCNNNATDSFFTATINGLTVSSRYRVEVKAKRGVQGVGQNIQSVFNDAENVQIATTSEEVFVFDKLAASTSEDITFRIGVAANLGDELIVTGVSVKEYV